MANHDASNQALGYLYQVQCALLFLLSSEDSDVKICIEKFDDISFHKDLDITEQLQLKYHSKNGNITNTSIDLWRTLNVWIDEINKNPLLIETTKFYIITTNSIAPDSVIEKIKHNNHDKNIYSELKQIAESGLQKSDTDSQRYKYYSSFCQLKEEQARKLIESMIIIPDFYLPSKIDDKILSKMRIFTTKKTENIVFEELLGWWCKKIIACLENPMPTFISFEELRMKINSIISDLRNDTLPVDVTEKEIEAIKPGSDTNNMINQLNLIAANEKIINNALKNYYKAYAQRSKWIKEILIYSEELDNYDKKLNDEWEFQFAAEIDNIDEDSSDDEKIKTGKELYKILMNKDIPIRPNLNDISISRGSYNGLANELKIGWHPNFKEILANNIGK